MLLASRMAWAKEGRGSVVMTEPLGPVDAAVDVLVSAGDGHSMRGRSWCSLVAIHDRQDG